MNLRDRLTGLAATLAVLLLLVGLPVLLTLADVHPWPHGAPSLGGLRRALAAPDDGTLALGAVAVVAWLAWAVIAVCILAEIVGLLRGVRAPALPGLAVPQGAVHGLVIAAALLFVAAPVGSTPPAHAGPAAPGPAATGPAAAQTAGSVSLVGAVTPTSRAPMPDFVPVRSAAVASSPHITGTNRDTRHTVDHRVRAGESLWSIAQDHLGDGRRFDEIVALNRHLIGDPDFLEPGWTLRIPVASTADGTAAANGGQAAGETYVVQPGDTLSQIAEDHLGRADAYPRIFDASRATTQPDRRRLKDPDLIDVGWHLTLPQPRRATPAEQSRHDGESHTEPETAPPHAGPAPRPRADNNADNNAGSSDVDRDGHPVQGRDETTGPAPSADASTHQRADATAQAGAHTGAVTETDEAAPWVLTGLTGGGVVLAAGLLVLLRARRRTQLRFRRPGRSIPRPDPDTAPVEATILTTGAPAAATLQTLDLQLRLLSTQAAAAERPMPSLAAVQLTEGTIVLHLAAPHDLPEPWIGTEDRLHFSLEITGLTTPPTEREGDAAQLVGEPPEESEPPYPLLLSVGTTDDGDVLLLNGEHLGVLTVTGDPDFSRDFARYIAAEVATNPWAEYARVDCIGIGQEIIPINPVRVHHHPTSEGTPDADDSIRAVLAAVAAHAKDTVTRAEEEGISVETGRSAHPDVDAWPARMLLIDTVGLSSEAPGGNDAGHEDLVDRLIQLIADGGGRSATCVLRTGGSLEAPPRANAGDQELTSVGLELVFTPEGRLLIPEVGLDLVPVGLTSDEARGCAVLLDQADEIDDVPTPSAQADSSPVDALASATGALHPDLTGPRAVGTARDGPRNGVGTTTVLGADDTAYTRTSAVTAEDLQALAPRVPAHVRRRVTNADPHLDADLAAWHDAETIRPRLATLGVVRGFAFGNVEGVAKRRMYYTGLLAYLVNRAATGATVEEAAEAMQISNGRVRTDIQAVRNWLGVEPTTGDPYLPDARRGRAARERGVNAYQVETGPSGVLWDLDLFRRLRLRGQVRGAEGIKDYMNALALVTDVPFTHLRERGWAWLLEHDRLDLEIVAAIADVALTASTHWVERGDLDQATVAVEAGIQAAPHDESLRLQRVAIAEADGRHDEAQALLNADVEQRSDDGGAPLDLSDRTEQIIRRHNWRATG